MKIISFLIATVLSATVFAGGPKPGSGRSNRDGKPEVSKSTVKEALMDLSAKNNKETAKAIPGFKGRVETFDNMSDAVMEAHMARQTKFYADLNSRATELIMDKTKAKDIGNLVNEYMEVLSIRHKFEDDAELSELADAGFKHITTRLNDTTDNPTSTEQLSKMFKAFGSRTNEKFDAEDFAAIKDSIKSIFGGDFTIRDIINCKL